MKNVLRGSLLFFSTGMLLFLFATTAQSVVPAATIDHETQQTSQEWARPDVTQRAQSEVQVKRLKNMFAKQQISSDDFFDRIQILLQSSSSR